MKEIDLYSEVKPRYYQLIPNKEDWPIFPSLRSHLLQNEWKVYLKCAFKLKIAYLVHTLKVVNF